MYHLGEEEVKDLDCSELLFFSGLHINNTDQLKSFLDICVSSGQICLFHFPSPPKAHCACRHTVLAALFRPFIPCRSRSRPVPMPGRCTERRSGLFLCIFAVGCLSPKRLKVQCGWRRTRVGGRLVSRDLAETHRQILCIKIAPWPFDAAGAEAGLVSCFLAEV